MDKIDLISYWRKFFSDLLVGTFKTFFFYGLMGGLAGGIAFIVIKAFYISISEWSAWVQWVCLMFALMWYGFWGIFHGFVAGILKVLGKKLGEMVHGLQDLMDFLVGGVLAGFPKVNKTFSKGELDQKFDELGQKFMKDLKLKGGLINWIKRILFLTILKVLKFMFLDDIKLELDKKNKSELTRADIESAVRRVGVEFFVSTIHEKFLIFHILNIALALITFFLPFLPFWLL